MNWLLHLRVDHTAFLVAVDVAMVIIAILLIPRGRSRPRPWLAWPVPVLVGAGIGLLLTWLIGDVADAFGLTLTPITRMWVALGFAGIALAVTRLWTSSWWRRIIAAMGIPIMALGALAGINVDFGAYRNLHDALGLGNYPTLTESIAPASAARTWTPPVDMPRTGIVRRVAIPGPTSRFAARDAVVYLPPAALTANPPRLPVILMFAGQPGAPSDMFTAGRVEKTLDAYATAHHGIAPMVVAPDQLGAPDRNPMCVDSPLGDVASYITIDVTRWIRSHLPVATDPDSWAIAGYSEGGTCAMQFGAGHPDLFSSILSISGELAPTIGAKTVDVAFHGSAEAYRHAQPLSLLAAHGPYTGSYAIFGAGQDDAKFSTFQHTTDAAAKAAGMQTEFISSPGTAHDWNTVRYVLARGLPKLADRLVTTPAA
ncbi:alpha/beta hydrolase-fold protein [Lysinimonas soli]|uniref:Alpha/beta hydrolase-fold protein n=1 Tax=Lysinimonas soli TaxID=1074233 RepID=A0ABW0NQY9_9MICO